MRNRFLTTLVLLSVFLCPALLAAQSPAPSSPGKIGLLNIQEAIATTAEGKKALAALDAKYQPKRAELQRLQQEIASLEDQLQRGVNTLSDDAKARMTRDHDDKQTVMKRTQEDAQRDFQLDNQEIGRRIGQKLVRVISDYAQQNGFEVVMDPAAAQVPVYFAAKEVDILEDIVKRYDAANPVASELTPGTTPGSKPAAAKPASKPPEKPKP